LAWSELINDVSFNESFGVPILVKLWTGAGFIRRKEKKKQNRMVLVPILFKLWTAPPASPRGLYISLPAARKGSPRKLAPRSPTAQRSGFAAHGLFE
jgi:hypothetical protein